MRGLKGKIVVIAGGATGIGAATAVRLGEEGAIVIVGDINAAGAASVADRIKGAGGKAHSTRFDISDEASVRDLVNFAVQTCGGIDHIHVNAADLSVVQRDTNAVDVPLDVFDRTIEADLRGHLLCTRYAVPEMLKRGGGAIVYTSSGAAFIGEPERVAYGIAKAGVNALMRHVASRWGKHGIRSNAVAPGLVRTTAIDHLGEATLAAILEAGRSTRIGEPDDIASMVVMLMSDDGNWVNGQVISVDGGITMR